MLFSTFHVVEVQSQTFTETTTVLSADWIGNIAQNSGYNQITGDTICPGTNNNCWDIALQGYVERTVTTIGYTNIELIYSMSSGNDLSGQESCVIEYSTTGIEPYTNINIIDSKNIDLPSAIQNAWAVDNLSQLRIRLRNVNGGCSCYFNDLILSGTTAAPTTNIPTTDAPTTATPTTSQPTTSQPTTSQPTTSQPTTSAPTTSQPTTSQPTTTQPTTSQPTTSAPTTSNPTSGSPTTAAPTGVPTKNPSLHPTQLTQPPTLNPSYSTQTPTSNPTTQTRVPTVTSVSPTQTPTTTSFSPTTAPTDRPTYQPTNAAFWSSWYGANGGTWKSISSPNGDAYITQICVYYASYVYRMKGWFSDGTSKGYFGPTSGSGPYCCSVNNGVCFNKVSVRYGALIDQVKFYKSNGESCGTWGGYSGAGPYVVDGTTNCLKAIEVQTGGGFDRIRFYFSSTPNPTLSPTPNPTIKTINPTTNPTIQPTINTLQPTLVPTTNPTFIPTKHPTIAPTMHPTQNPTEPTVKPTQNPTHNPTVTTITPTKSPTKLPTDIPSAAPTTPSGTPTKLPTTSVVINGVVINGILCVSNNVVVVNNYCYPGSPHYDFEGVVCANDNTPTEAYCSYAIGPNACAYCRETTGTSTTNYPTSQVEILSGGKVCPTEGHSINIDCGSKKIWIVSAHFGRNCDVSGIGNDQSVNLRAACNGLTSCDYTIRVSIIGDPYYGCCKNYDYEYYCSSASFSPTPSTPPSNALSISPTLPTTIPSTSPTLSPTATPTIYASTADIPPPVDPGSYWKPFTIEIAPENNFYPEGCNSQTLRPVLGYLSWWNPSTYNQPAGYYPVGVAFTYATIDVNTMQIEQQTPLSKLMYKSYSHPSYCQPWFNVQQPTDANVNAVIAYMLNLADTTQWRKIGTYIVNGNNQLETGVSVKVGHGGTTFISFQVQQKLFSNNGGTVIDVLYPHTPCPTWPPTSNPTKSPTSNPSISPTGSTINPTKTPTYIPTINPTKSPTYIPTINPTFNPSINPTIYTTTELDTESNVNNGGKSMDNDNNTSSVLIILLVIVFLVFACLAIVVYIKKKKSNVEVVNLQKLASHSVINRKEIRINENNHLQTWLTDIGLMEYYNLFVENGFNEQFENISELTMDGLKDMGIEKLAHRLCIMKNMKMDTELDEGIVYGNNNTINTTNVNEGNGTTNGHIELVTIHTEKGANNIDEIESKHSTLGIDNFDNESDDKENDDKEQIKHWLTHKVNVEQYYGLLMQNGFDTFESIQDLDDNILKQIGIQKIGHRIKLLKYINELDTV